MSMWGLIKGPAHGMIIGETKNIYLPLNGRSYPWSFGGQEY